MRALVFALAVVSSACATVDQSRMTEGCKALYKSCIASCPNENARQADVPNAQQTTPAGQAMGAQPAPTPVSNAAPRDAANCTQECANQAEHCE